MKKFVEQCEEPLSSSIDGRHWLGERRRAGSRYYTQPAECYETIIARSSFRNGDPLIINYERNWTIEQIVGFCYSTSYCSPPELGEKKNTLKPTFAARSTR